MTDLFDKFKAWLETEEGKAAAAGAGVETTPAEPEPPAKPDPITDLAQRLRLDLTQHVVDTITAWVDQRGAELHPTVEESSASDTATEPATATATSTASPSAATVPASEATSA